MLQILIDLEAKGSGNTDVAFTQAVRARSECTSSLKGGDLAGDLGWLKMPEVKVGERIPKDVAARMLFVRTAASLEIGELSDIVVDDDGVHILKRSA